jgi:glycosyltransferase involved in cell wall biosynthesis
MRILFVASCNSEYYEVAPFIKSQGNSLSALGIEVAYFPVLGKGMMGYLKSSFRLRRFLKENKFDLVHAHYSLCGWVAVLAFLNMPIVLSLMGDDALGTFFEKDKISVRSYFLMALTRCVQPFVQAIIYKSPNLGKAIHRKEIAHLVPNGVRLVQFEVHPAGYREELGLFHEKKYVLFLGDPADLNKNIKLVQLALAILSRPDVELVNVYRASHDVVVKYLNSMDIFVMCSFSEGSPNVVKEAMACDCPMVVTDAGDAAWVAGSTPGCYVASFDAQEFAEKLALALDFSEKTGRTQGRERILELGLDARTIANQLSDIYGEVLKPKKLETHVRNYRNYFS